MTKEELIKRWTEEIIPCVFQAEQNLRNELDVIISNKTYDLNQKMYLYKRTIAEHIVNKFYSDNREINIF